MSTDTALRRAERSGDRAEIAKARARAGLCVVRRWDGDGYGNGNGNGNGNGDGDGYGDGNGNGYGDGYGDGNGNGYGYGDGDGYGDGNGDGYGNGYGDGNGDGNGYGDGNGDGNGDGDGNGNGYGDGNGKGVSVQTDDVIQIGNPVVIRSYVSGVIVGRLRAGATGSVALTDWRWLRRWEGVGGEGSVYDLVRSDKVPSRRGPLTSEAAVFQQADVMVIDESTYKRLAT